MILVDTGSTNFHTGLQYMGRKVGKVEFCRCVESSPLLGLLQSLHAIRAHNGTAGQMAHVGVITRGIEFILVTPGFFGRVQPFVQFDIENVISQSLNGFQVLTGADEIQLIRALDGFFWRERAIMLGSRA